MNIKTNSKAQRIAYLKAIQALLPKITPPDSKRSYSIEQYVEYAGDEYPNILLYEDFSTYDMSCSTNCISFVEAIDKIISKGSRLINLNSDYIAEILENGDVKIGCQTFSKEDIQKFIKSYQELVK